MKMNYEKTGGLIQEARKEKGLTQLQLAEVLGVTDRAISKWERGKSFPDVAMLKPLAETLELSVVELLDGERRAEAPLTSEEAGEAAIKGIQAYVSENERRQQAYKRLAVIGLVLAVIAFCLWKYSHRPVDFSEGVFDFGTAAVDQEGEEDFVMALDGGSYDQMVKGYIKAFLAENTEMLREISTLPMSQEWVRLNNPGNGEPLVSFSSDGYIDHRSGKCYTCDYFESLFCQLKSILADYHGETAGTYQYKGRQVYRYKDRQLIIEDLPDSSVEELIVEWFRNELKEDVRPEFPDACKPEVRIQSIRWLPEEDYDDFYLHFINKEIAYQELYDYRIYEVTIDETYNDALRNLIPQDPEGQKVYLFLLGKIPSEPTFSICYIMNTMIC